MFLFYIPNTWLCDGPLFGTGVNLLMHICPGGGAKQPSDRSSEHFLKRLSFRLLRLNESHIKQQ